MTITTSRVETDSPAMPHLRYMVQQAPSPHLRLFLWWKVWLHHRWPWCIAYESERKMMFPEPISQVEKDVRASVKAVVEVSCR